MATTTFIRGKGEARRVRIGEASTHERHTLIMAGWLPVDEGMEIRANLQGEALEGTVQSCDGDEITVELSAPWGDFEAGELVEVLTDEVTMLDGRNFK
jgi:hypothetical protein